MDDRGSDASFFSNAMFLVLACFIVVSIGKAVIHAGEHANIVPTQLAAK